MSLTTSTTITTTTTTTTVTTTITLTPVGLSPLSAASMLHHHHHHNNNQQLHCHHLSSPSLPLPIFTINTNAIITWFS
ncbi:hypothetical protein SMA75_26595, partial [Escherichia coli]|uniref:hypothetical protein n=1 Tax=Escherichia coli TaxID=562 RepID=UPI0030791ECE